MNSTFGFGIAGPAARTRVLPRFDGFRAGPAADAWITVIMQRVIGQVVRLDMLPYLVTRPLSQRIELDHLVGIIPFDKFCICPECRLVATDAGDPGVVVGEELPLRDHFTDLATGIRVAIP